MQYSTVFSGNAAKSKFKCLQFHIFQCFHSQTCVHCTNHHPSNWPGFVPMPNDNDCDVKTWRVLSRVQFHSTSGHVSDGRYQFRIMCNGHTGTAVPWAHCTMARQEPGVKHSIKQMQIAKILVLPNKNKIQAACKYRSQFVLMYYVPFCYMHASNTSIHNTTLQRLTCLRHQGGANLKNS